MNFNHKLLQGLSYSVFSPNKLNDPFKNQFFTDYFINYEFINQTILKTNVIVCFNGTYYLFDVGLKNRYKIIDVYDAACLSIFFNINK